MRRRDWRALLLLLLTGCATRWQAQTAPPAEVLRFTHADAYLVTRVNGNQVELLDAVIERDSLIGLEKPDPTGPDVRVRRAIALSDVKQIAIREHDGTATAIWIAITGTFIVLLALGLTFAAGMGD